MNSGLNTAANHNFLAHDGIVTYNELVDAQQNVYNVGYDLANLLAILGLTLTDGDLVTEKLSIGCDATSRTSVSPALTGSEPGLDGHSKSYFLLLMLDASAHTMLRQVRGRLLVDP